ncbi:hypothetical protein RHODGE_RHODGE_03280 [Rhodoplanes serenus]|uniref:Tyr recombinase domain-containing protein n=1 Tax=Rhodoplanes serenus TaxID=200615 RepID=A0A447CXX6_9BRAD|nr:integrase [Rhodoplanes serenus]VCU10094.1 hypothetical protein RHODGE_RHODGE_03280 [Rhodoplanes serenus]
MPRKRAKATRAVIDLPKGVHRVISRGREYFYFQAGRGTAFAGQRVALPSDPHSPDFWAALRRAQGVDAGETVVTFGAVAELYEQSPQFAVLTKGSRAQYRRGLKIARAAWGLLPAEGLRPVHVRALLDGMADRTGTANTVLGVLRALSSWGRERDHFPHSLTEGVKPYAKSGGHRPWTDCQLAAAEKHLTGMVRRGFFLLRYTGQRGSDVVRLGETFIDDGGFRLAQQKTGRDVWCPIDDALAAEMSTWPREPGPYLRHGRGPYTRKILDKHFAEQRDKVPELAGVTLHGLRGTRVIELRRLGLTTTQIQDQVGMSLAMIERYCRFADRKASGQASVVSLRERRATKK